MSGADKGKRELHGEEAKRLYVEQGMSCTAIAARFDVAVSSVCEWRDWDNWDEARRRRKAAGNAVDELRAEAEKELAKLRGREGEYSTMDPSKRIDIMAKLKSILKQDTKQIDPRRQVEFAIGTIFGLANYLGKKDADLNNALSVHIHPFISDIRRGKIQIDVMPSEVQDDD